MCNFMGRMKFMHHVCTTCTCSYQNSLGFLALNECLLAAGALGGHRRAEVSGPDARHRLRGGPDELGQDDGRLARREGAQQDQVYMSAQ